MVCLSRPLVSSGRRKSRSCGLNPSRVDQHAAIGIAMERSAANRRKDVPDSERDEFRHRQHLRDAEGVACSGPGGSACCYWNGCGSSVTTRCEDVPKSMPTTLPSEWSRRKLSR